MPMLYAILEIYTRTSEPWAGELRARRRALASAACQAWWPNSKVRYGGWLDALEIALGAMDGRSKLGRTTGAACPVSGVPPAAQIAIELNAQNIRTANTGIRSARIVQANIF